MRLLAGVGIASALAALTLLPACNRRGSEGVTATEAAETTGPAPAPPQAAPPGSSPAIPSTPPIAPPDTGATAPVSDLPPASSTPK